MSIKILQRYTSRDTISMVKYFEEVKKFPILSTEDEVKFATLAIGGDEIAKEMLVKSNLRFVISVAKQYEHRGVTIEDLINEGNIGLIEAAGRFDPTKGFKFISYAVWYIRNKIQLILTDSERKCMFIPHSRVSKMNKVRKMITNAYNKLEREVMPMDLYGCEEFSNTEIDGLFLLINGKDTSMDREIGEDGFTVGDLMCSNSYEQTTKTMDNEYTKTLLSTMVNQLSARDIIIVSHLHGLNDYELLNVSELAAELDLTRQRIDQIYKRALRVMKGMARKNEYENI